MSWLSLGLGYVLTYAIGVAMLAGYPRARALMATAALFGAALIPIVVILRQRQRWAGCQRLFWLTIAAGLAVWSIGHAGWAYGTFVEGRTQWVDWHTVFSFSGGAAPLIALFAWPHLGPRRHAYAATAVDIAAIWVVSGFMVSYFILIPSLDPALAPLAWASLPVSAQVQRLLMLGGMIAAAVVARSLPWGATYGRLAIVLGLGAVVRMLLNAALLAGTYESGRLYDLAWIVPYLGYAWAADEAPSSPADEPDTARRQPAHPWVITSAFAGAATVGYGVHLAWPLGQTVDDTRVLFTTLMTLVGFVLVTIRMVVQRSQLQYADHRMRMMANVSAHTKDLVVVVRADGLVQEVNGAFLATTGFDASDLKQAFSADLLARSAAPVLPELRAAVARDGVWRGTLERLKKDGTSFPVACTVTALRDDQGRITHLVGVERDVSDEIRMREQLVRSERLAATSEVVAGVAHEINNPLQAILGCTELLLDGAEGEARSDLEIVRSEAVRAGQIVRNLLAFVRRGPGERQLTDLNDLVRSTVALRSYSLSQDGITVDLAGHAGPLPVNVNQEEIRQIVLNLLLNAGQALRSAGRGGRIRIRTSLAGRDAVVDVSDDGPGIPADHRGRIFEPFFTTREVGEGAGLGLSISLGIALAHGGTLQHEPAPGGGASFRLTLPKADEASSSGAPAPAGSPRRETSPPVALVVEDDESIRELLERLLVRRGYRVVQAADGSEALDRLRDSAPDVIMCDVRMPRMNGPEFYRQAVGQDATVAKRFVAMTGDNARADATVFATSAQVPLLQKPFSATDLDEVLRALKGQPAVRTTDR